MIGSSPVRVSLFGGVASIPVQIAHSHGLFAGVGLDVTIHQTSSSHELMSGLADGAFDIVHAAPDNFVEWRDSTDLPVVAWIGGATGWLGLFTNSPDVQSVADLSGRSVAVDAVNSGFVSVLRMFLRDAGLGEGEVAFEPLGATNLRFQALADGRATATMLTLPWAAKARAAGMRELARQNVDGLRLPGSCAGSLSAWLSANAGVADAYLRGVCAATTWLRLPQNHTAAEEAISSLMSLEPRYSEEVLAAIIDPVIGSPASGAVDLALMRNLIELRTANQQTPKFEAASYVDFGPYERVFMFGLSSTISSPEYRNPGERND